MLLCRFDTREIMESITECSRGSTLPLKRFPLSQHHLDSFEAELEAELEADIWVYLADRGAPSETENEEDSGGAGDPDKEDHGLPWNLLSPRSLGSSRA